MKVLNLKDVKITKKEEQDLADVMANGPKLNEALADADLFDVETVRKMIAIEKRTKSRLSTLAKLVGRFKTLLGREIDRELAGS
jgi:hypothetical protein